MIKLCRILLIGLLSIANVQAEDKLHYNVVSFQVTAERQVDNDLMRVWLTVQHEHKQAAQAATKVNQDSQWALAQAKKVSSVKASTLNYATQPRYDDRRVIGWTVRQQVLLEGENFREVSELTTALQQKLQVSHMAFLPTTKTRQATENALTEEALKAFTEKAQRVTQSLGQEDYDIVDIQLGDRHQVRPVMRQKAEVMSLSSYADSEIAVEAGTSTLKVTAAGRIQLR